MKMAKKVIYDAWCPNPETVNSNTEEQNENSKNILWTLRTKEFMCSDWSVAGLKYVVRDSGLGLRRAIWLFFVLFGFGFMTFQILERIQYYLTNPTTVDIKINHKSEIVFPTITICNENIIDESKAKKLNNFDAMIKNIYPPYPKPGYQPKFSIKYKKEYQNVSYWEDIWKVISPSDGKKIIYDCSYNHQVCIKEQFEYVATSMGYCVQFNGVNSTYATKRTGATNGLWIMFYIDQSNYLYTRSRAAGVRVMLHTKKDIPLVYELGFKAAVGQVTSAAVRLKSVNQLPQPYGNCSANKDYMFKECSYSCLHEYIYNNCGCRYYYYKASTDQNACSPEEMYLCCDKVLSEFIKGQLQETICTCPPQCHTDYYEYSLSSAPQSQYSLGIGADHKCTLDNLACKNNPSIKKSVMEQLNKNYGELEIYFDELLHEEVTTEPAYTLLALLCDVGGALGLILGSTVLTVFELFDFIIVMLYDYILYRNRSTKPKSIIHPN